MKVDVRANLNVWNAGDLVKETAAVSQVRCDQLGRFSGSSHCQMSVEQHSSVTINIMQGHKWSRGASGARGQQTISSRQLFVKLGNKSQVF